MFSGSRFGSEIDFLRESPYSQRFTFGIAIPGTQLGIVTEDFNNFITTEDGGILTTEG